jgi:amino acid permease
MVVFEFLTRKFSSFHVGCAIRFYAGINVLCGVGILSTPYAIKQGGWIGLAILCTFALLAWYTGVLLRHCLDSKEGLKTYPDIGHAAFGSTGRIVISVNLLQIMIANLTVRFVFCASCADYSVPCLWLRC